MGHAFQHTLMDALTRYHRMRGDATLWQPGTDHAGIATQMVVERQLNAEGKKRTDLGREAFIERVWKWKEQSGGTMASQMRRLGDSVDWSRDRVHDGSGPLRRRHRSVRASARRRADLSRQAAGQLGSRAAQRPVGSRSAAMNRRKANSGICVIRWRMARRIIVVATTRPETMFGDTAVAVNPDDERYKQLVGKKIRLPLTERLIPDHRRLLRRSGIRLRGGQDHARPRFQRL